MPGRPTTRACVLLCALSCACASAPRSPFFGDEKYLRFGVDPRAEANAVIESHKTRGDRLVRRIEGRDFTALGFVDSHGVPDAVRVVTARGIALSLDRDATPLAPDTRYELVPSPLEHDQDADGDGFEEVFVNVAQTVHHCLHVYRARDVGVVDEVPVTVTLFGATACPSDVVDLDQDGRVELVVEVAPNGDDTADAPRVRAPLWANEHRFVLDATRDSFVRYRAQEEGARVRDLQEAKQALDVPKALRLAIELAALSYLAGESSAAQTQAFDTALLGLVLSEPEAESVHRARTRILESWNLPPSPNPDRAARNAAP